MAGLKAFFNGYWLADLTTEVISAAGALVKPLGIRHAWTQLQYSPPHDFADCEGEIAFAFGTAGYGQTYKYDLANGSATMMAPDYVVEGYRFSLLVTADASHEIGYEGGSWTYGTETAPDFSAMTNGDQVLIDFYGISNSRVFCVASPVFAA